MEETFTKLDAVIYILVFLVVLWFCFFPLLVMNWSNKPTTKDTRFRDWAMVIQIVVWLLVLGSFLVYSVLWFISLPSGL